MSVQLISYLLSYLFSALGQFVLILLLLFLGATANLQAGPFCLTPFPTSVCSGCCPVKFQLWTQSLLGFLLETCYFLSDLLPPPSFKDCELSFFRTSMSWLIFHLFLCLTSRPRRIFTPIDFISLHASKQCTQPLLWICAQPMIYFLSCSAVQIPHQHQIQCSRWLSSLIIKRIVNLIFLVRCFLRLSHEITEKILPCRQPPSSPASFRPSMQAVVCRRWYLLPLFSACL